MRMTLTPDSTAIYGFSYNQRLRRLTLVFRDHKTQGRGTKGRYLKVSPLFFLMFLLAESKGKAHATWIKGNFPYVRVSAA